MSLPHHLFSLTHLVFYCFNLLPEWSSTFHTIWFHVKILPGILLHSLDDFMGSTNQTEVLQTWKFQQKNTGYNTSAAFFPNGRILLSPICLNLVTTTKHCLNHSNYRCIRTLVCAADRELLTKQLFIWHTSMVHSLWLLLPWVIALHLCSHGRRGGDHSHR